MQSIEFLLSHFLAVFIFGNGKRTGNQVQMVINQIMLKLRGKLKHAQKFIKNASRINKANTISALKKLEK